MPNNRLLELEVSQVSPLVSPQISPVSPIKRRSIESVLSPLQRFRPRFRSASESFELLGLDVPHHDISGVNLGSPSYSQDLVKKNATCADWLLAASLIHKAKYEVKDLKR